MRQLIVNLKFEHPGFTPHEIATICFLHFERRPSDHTVKRILADGPKPSISGRRYPSYAEIADGYQRRRAIVDLHAEGWSNTTISAYLSTPRHRVYEVLKRWAEEGHAGLDDRPTSAPRSPARKVTMNAITEVRKSVRESSELGAYRVHALLEQIGIHLSQATCGRLLSLNRKLYGVPKPSGGAPRVRREMPFKAHFKHEIWSVDVRHIEEHNLGFPEPVYLISILENYSRSCLASKISPTQNQWDFLEVLFYWKTLDREPTPRKQRTTDIIQLPLLENPPLSMAVGADTGHVESDPGTRLRLMGEPQIDQETEE